MLHPQDSRRARRAARTRRTHATGAVVVTGLLALAALSATAPAFAIAPSSASDSRGRRRDGIGCRDPERDLSADAQSALGAARAALAVARDVTSDVAASDLELGTGVTDLDTTIDTTALRDDIDRLSDLDVMPALLLTGITADTTAETQPRARAGDAAARTPRRRRG